MTTTDENKAFVKEILGLRSSSPTIQTASIPGSRCTSRKCCQSAATMKDSLMKIASTARNKYIAEQFAFDGRNLIDVRAHVCDAQGSKS